MQPSLGEIIAHLRRQRHLTQRQLAGERFSKSYVSAVEHNRITPSADALHFLVERLGLSDDEMTSLLATGEISNGLSLRPQPDSHLAEVFPLLETLLKESGFARQAPSSDLPMLSAEVLSSFPPHLQARYSFLLGLQARARGDLPAALQAFKAVLALAPVAQQANALEAISSLSLEMKQPLSALGYALHAFDLLAHSPVPMRSALQLPLALHCGDALRQLGYYQPALSYYKQAHTLLKAEHEVATAAHVYEGLGYCTYAALFPDAALSASFTQPFLAEVMRPADEIEDAFERASSLLLQSANLARVGGKRRQQMALHCLLACIQLDRSVWLRRTLAEHASSNEKETVRNQCLTFLHEAARYCRQALLDWQDPLGHAEITPDVESSIYRALALLIRIPVQRAVLARLQGQAVDVAYRNLALAASLCQQVLETLSTEAIPWTVIQQALHLSAETLDYRSISLPHFSEPLRPSPRCALSLSEVYFAAAEVAEELGRTSPTIGYERDCYLQANQFFQAALSLARRDLEQEGREPGLLARLCLRNAAILEERSAASPTLYQETSITLLRILTFCSAHLPSVSESPRLREREREGKG